MATLTSSLATLSLLLVCAAVATGRAVKASGCGAGLSAEGRSSAVRGSFALSSRLRLTLAETATLTDAELRASNYDQSLPVRPSVATDIDASLPGSQLSNGPAGFVSESLRSLAAFHAQLSFILDHDKLPLAPPSAPASLATSLAALREEVHILSCYLHSLRPKTKAEKPKLKTAAWQNRMDSSHRLLSRAKRTVETLQLSVSRISEAFAPLFPDTRV